MESKEAGNLRRIDWVGALLSIVAMASLVFGLVEGRSYGWWLVNKPFIIGDWSWSSGISVIPVCFLVFALATTAFILWGRSRIAAGKPTLIAFNLFGIASFRNGNVAAMVISLGEFGIILSLPLWLQFVIGYNALQTGFVILALAVGAFTASGLAGGLGGRVSPVRTVQLGIILEVIGVAAVGFSISPTSTWINVVPWLFVYGLGVGLATAQLTNVILKDVPIQESGQASGTQSTSRQLGSALGIAILGTILFTSAQLQLTNSLTDAGTPPAQVTSIVSAVVDSAGGAIVGFAAAGFLVLGFFSTLSLGKGRKEADQHAPVVDVKPVSS